MDQKVVLITGCSSGIGLALAVLIAKDEKNRFMGNFLKAAVAELSEAPRSGVKGTADAQRTLCRLVVKANCENDIQILFSNSSRGCLLYQ